jgi:hypothetical protein
MTCALIAWVATRTATREQLPAAGVVLLVSLAMHWRRRQRAAPQSDGTT